LSFSYTIKQAISPFNKPTKENRNEPLLFLIDSTTLFKSRES
jgi:hypothetical protein